MLVYDCEIINCIPTGELNKNYKYCGGWRDFKNMGISVIGFYLDSPQTGNSIWYRGYLHELNPFHEFKKLVNNESQIVGFNSKQSDDNLCKANGINITTTYDLLEEIRLAAFGSPNWEDTPKGFSYSLGAIAIANGFAKTGTGSGAPMLWQEGKHQEVINYCVNDVKLTVELLKLGLRGKLTDPNTGGLLTLRDYNN
jgi:DEAD/DEAH box helicase domain-containing protein